MQVKHRFSFHVDERTKEIVDYINKNNLKYTVGKGIPILTIEVYEDDEIWNNINTLMKKHGINSLKECIYSKKEKNQAEWLRIRSKWRSEYPQPEDGSEFKSITYDDSNYCFNCGYGLKQKENFKLKKTPNWGRRNFLMVHWVESELFVSDEVVNELSKHQLNGLRFFDVLNYKTDAKLNNINQLKVNNILKKGLVKRNDIVIKETICPICNSIKFITSGRGIIYNKSVFDVDVDIVKSYESFGDGLVCAKIIFISQKIYKILLEKGWDKELVIEPVQLV